MGHFGFSWLTVGFEGLVAPPWSSLWFLVHVKFAEVLPWNFVLQPCVEVAMENVMKYLVKFCCFSLFLRKRISKVPRICHDKFHTMFSPMPNFMAFFTLQTFVLADSSWLAFDCSISLTYLIFSSVFTSSYVHFLSGPLASSACRGGIE